MLYVFYVWACIQCIAYIGMYIPIQDVSLCMKNLSDDRILRNQAFFLETFHENVSKNNAQKDIFASVD